MNPNPTLPRNPAVRQSDARPCEGDAAFWSKVDTSAGPDACWPWMGETWEGGDVGKVMVGDKARSARRVAWELANPDQPPPSWLRQTCESGNSCCNPRHMEPTSRKGANSPRAVLSEDDVNFILRRLAAGTDIATLARACGVSYGAVSNIANGVTWKHIPRPERP